MNFKTSLPHLPVAGIDRGGLDPHHDLILAGGGQFVSFQTHFFGPAVAVILNSFHWPLSSENSSKINFNFDHRPSLTNGCRGLENLFKVTCR